MTIAVKICGLSDEISVRAVIESGADFVGFVHYPKSPRHVSIEKAAQLKSLLPESIKSVMVVVDPNDELLVEIASEMQPDYLQLHGNESQSRIREIISSLRGKAEAIHNSEKNWIASSREAPRNDKRIGIIKAISVRNSDDIKIAEDYHGIADFLLFDAKPTNDKMMYGGNGIAFDWDILSGNLANKNWFLAGGLNAENVEQAIKISGAKMVDVSSGVERSSGVKDAKMIEDFVKTVRDL